MNARDVEAIAKERINLEIVLVVLNVAVKEPLLTSAGTACIHGKIKIVQLTVGIRHAIMN